MVRLVAAGAFLLQLLVLAAIAGTIGLSPVGWAVGAAVGMTVGVLLVRGLARSGTNAVAPPHWVTLGRSILVGAVSALVADAWVGPVHLVLLVVLATAALILDAVDGLVARQTATVSAVGARFDMELDAFLILVLSVQVARGFGSWVLLIGLARYAYVVSGWVWRWLREVPPPRQWRKTVAAIQGIVLTVAVVGVLPRPVVYLIVAVALTLLADSFGRDAWWLWERHKGRELTEFPPVRVQLAWMANACAVALLWAALVLPHSIGDLAQWTFVSLPLELVIFVGLTLVLPSRVRTVFAVVVGVLAGVLTVLKTLDLGFSSALERPFHPLLDLGTFHSAVGVLRDSVGGTAAVVAVIGAIVAVVLLVAGLIWAAVRLARLSALHRHRSVRAVVAAAVVWLVFLGVGAGTSAVSVATASTSRFAYDQVRQIPATLADQRAFERQLTARDPVAAMPAAELLTGLRGKDVLLVVVESYGVVAVQNSPISATVDSALRRNTTQLDAAGFGSRSGFLTSPTFGGISWLAHSTMQSGLWIDSQQRYDQLMASDRSTLSDVFKRAGWRTVADIPSNTEYWPDGHSFYHYDKVYNSLNVGYAGPRFSYARVPDQYTLAAFWRNELAKPSRRPVMAEIDLVSSHTPWAPLPKLVPWNEIGDGSIYRPMPAEGRQPSQVWQHARDVQRNYGRSIRYSLAAITSFVQHAHDPNLVLVIYGDHQPSSTVSGPDASHNVPVSIVAHDPKVLDRVDSWGWNKGLLPDPDAPTWPMDQFRGRFLAAFGPRPDQTR